jgi:predicted type IV restriction endonuclease
MATMPNKVKDRLASNIRRFQNILSVAKSRDVNESDTVIIVTDMLCDIFGFDKYSEITSEYSIRNTYADLAIKTDGAVQILIEVKAIGLDLKEAHTKQAVDYAANEGIDWVVLTNGIFWQIYKISFGKPISQELVLQIDFPALNPKNKNDLEKLFLITKEGLKKSALGEYQIQRQVLSRFFIGAVLMGDSVSDVIRRELRRISPDVKIDTEQIKIVLAQEVIKREVLEGEKADEAKRKVLRVAKRILRKANKETGEETPEVNPANANNPKTI